MDSPSASTGVPVRYRLRADAQDMIRRLLDPERETRLGVGDHTSIRNHAWLSSLDWASINSRALKAPFIPDSKRANFDAHQDDIMAALDVNQARRPHALHERH